MKKNNKLFNYLVISVVLIIPFMYSFFYLKAYWNPYGEGNIDNIPVAIVNEDEGDKGESLINRIKDSDKLKLSVVSKEDAEKGLNKASYYAVISIPNDFTESMKSASTDDKKHATITYSPNQKANYLASQIINSVVNAVEKNLDNEVNSAIISGLSESVNSVPNSLDTISNGFGELKTGTSKLHNGSYELLSGAYTLQNGVGTLSSGSSTLKNGLSELNTNYKTFDLGIKQTYNGSIALENGLKELNDSKDKIDTLIYSINTLKTNYNALNIGIGQYIDGVNASNQEVTNIVTNLLTYYQMTQNGMDGSSYLSAAITNANNIKNASSGSNLSEAGQSIKNNSTAVRDGISTLNTEVSKLGLLKDGIGKAYEGSISLSNGLSTLSTKSNEVSSGISKVYDGSTAIDNGINSLSTGSKSLYSGVSTLNNGIITLDNSVSTAKSELDSKISTTKNDIKKTEDLSTYAKEPVKINTKIVNEVDTYGTSFAPLFISIGLWVGALMFYVVLYYDKNKRFGDLGIDSKNYLKRTLLYHVIATISGFVLALLLQLLLDFNITNYFLYYISIILIANTFIGIMELLIVNLGDVGKFLGLIILVLQLAASGGTFPIETVSKGFRFLNNYLPMTYTIKLLKESLISIESSLLTKNMIIVLVMCISLMIFNIINSIKKQNKN